MFGTNNRDLYFHIVKDVMVVKLFPSIHPVTHPVQLKVFCDSPSSSCCSNLLLLGNKSLNGYMRNVVYREVLEM
jgi:hypothetical protein